MTQIPERIGRGRPRLILTRYFFPSRFSPKWLEIQSKFFKLYINVLTVTLLNILWIQCALFSFLFLNFTHIFSVDWLRMSGMVGAMEKRRLWRTLKTTFRQRQRFINNLHNPSTIKVRRPRGDQFFIWIWNVHSHGPVAQWITRLTTDQKILGSTPGWLEIFFFHLSASENQITYLSAMSFMTILPRTIKLDNRCWPSSHLIDLN